MAAETGRGLLALRDRAYAFLLERGSASDEALLTYVYGGAAPAAVRERLAAPLLEDARLERGQDGTWRAKGRQLPDRRIGLADLDLTTLALVPSGPNPERGRVVQLCALHVRGGTTLARFAATLNPERRVPRYVAERLGVAAEGLDELPPFAAIVEDLVRFLGTRPVFAQDARLTWAFVSADARRTGQVLVEPSLLDANELATRLLDLAGKPTLALLAAHLGVGTLRIGRPEEEARVLALVAAPLLARAQARGLSSLEALLEPAQTGTDDDRALPLRRGQTARAQPDEPGVYVLRDAGQAALYVGKASRLRSRLAAYVHRPLGVTRRLEGLVGSVGGVDSTVCATDLEALVLEDREIRRLRPRYNTARRQRTPRLWIRLPPEPAELSRKRTPAARRLEASLGPSSADGDFIGPFRNETLAEQARLLARTVFELDVFRRGDPHAYAERLQLAWSFLHLGTELPAAVVFARRHSTRLVRQVLAFDPSGMLLPADPREARYAVVRPAAAGLEGFLVDQGILCGWSVFDDDQAAGQFAAELLAPQEPRTRPEDSDVVLRWFGAQRPPALLVHLPPSDGQPALAAADAIEVAALSLRQLVVDA